MPVALVSVADTGGSQDIWQRICMQGELGQPLQGQQGQWQQHEMDGMREGSALIPTDCENTLRRRRLQGNFGLCGLLGGRCG